MIPLHWCQNWKVCDRNETFYRTSWGRLNTRSTASAQNSLSVTLVILDICITVINSLMWTFLMSLAFQRPTQPSIPPGLVNEYQVLLGRQRQVWFIPLADVRGVCRWWNCEIHWERVPYLSTLEVFSRRGTIQIHIYLTLPLGTKSCQVLSPLSAQVVINNVFCDKEPKMAKSGASEERDPIEDSMMLPVAWSCIELKRWQHHLAGSTVDSHGAGRQYSGQHKAAEEDGDPETPGKSIWNKKCGQRASDAAGGRWRCQHKTELM